MATSKIAIADHTWIQDCITQLLIAHRAQPFGILREAGVVAELRSLLLGVGGQLCGTAKCSFLEKDPRKKLGARYIHASNQVVKRVQMEITVKYGLTSAAKTTLDIAVFAKTVTLLVAPNGPGDVIEQISTNDIVAGIEVKASPSIDPQERGKYLKDIENLLQLREHQGIAGFFVLLDKSQSLYGGWPGKISSQNLIQWASKPLQNFVIPLKIRRKFSSFFAAGILVDKVDPGREVPNIEIWVLSLGRQPECWYAYR